MQDARKKYQEKVVAMDLIKQEFEKNTGIQVQHVTNEDVRLLF